MIFWSETALERSGLAVNEGESLVYLTAPGDEPSEFEPCAIKEHARQAWEQHVPAAGPATAHVERYGELAKAMGY